MEQERLAQYWADIPIGRQNAVDYAALIAYWGIGERNVRRILHELSCYDSGDDYILIRSGVTRGFYRTDNVEEIERYRRECLNKGRSLFAPLRKFNRVLSARGQLQLLNRMRELRESKGLKQTDVCRYLQEHGAFIDAPTLSKMENGVCSPTYSQMLLLAELYDCTIADIAS